MFDWTIHKLLHLWCIQRNIRLSLDKRSKSIESVWLYGSCNWLIVGFNRELHTTSHTKAPGIRNSQNRIQDLPSHLVDDFFPDTSLTETFPHYSVRFSKSYPPNDEHQLIQNQCVCCNKSINYITFLCKAQPTLCLPLQWVRFLLILLEWKSC